MLRESGHELLVSSPAGSWLAGRSCFEQGWQDIVTGLGDFFSRTNGSVNPRGDSRVRVDENVRKPCQLEHLPADNFTAQLALEWG